jgi:lipoate-protein ligase A
LIRKGRKTQLIDYAEHTRPIINALKELSVEARLEGKSNLTTGGLKFSGNSEHIIKTRILHHGTLLFNTNLEELERALSMKHTDYEDKAVKSIRSKVTNIQDHLLHPMSILEFRDYLIEFFQRLYTSMHMYHLSEKEIYQIQKLAEEKYKSWEWNFGYSPIYKLERSIDITGELLHLSIEIEKGRIKNFTLVNQLGEPWDTEIQQKLLGLPHDKKVMLNTLNNINFASSSGKIKPEKFIEHLF